MRCKVHFVDLEGLNDGRALKNILPHVNPRRLVSQLLNWIPEALLTTIQVIVQAASNATDSLLEACKATRSMTTEVYAPLTGETIRIGEDMRNFTVALSDALMSSIKMSTVSIVPPKSKVQCVTTLINYLNRQYEDSEIAFIKGRISQPTTSGIPVLQPLRITHRKDEDTLMSGVEVSKEVATSNIPRAVMIGDLKLTSLRLRLNKAGISADFAGEGILVCRSAPGGGNASGDDEFEDTVAVRKTRKGEVRVEGDASALFYMVREEIYKLHALVETE